MLSNLSKPVKTILPVIGSIILGYILTFPFRLLDDAIQEFVRDYITRTFAMPVTTFIIYAASFAVAALIIWAAYKIGTLKRVSITTPKNEKRRQQVKKITKVDWVTCDKCGFIGVRNIKTRELEEMEDNQRRTGQPVLIRINQLGDKEPRHEKIPECLMQIQDFAAIPPLATHSSPLFYMQMPHQCQHFTTWQKGLSPKEHRGNLSTST